VTFGGRQVAGWALLSAALAFNATCLAPELRIDRVPINDGVFHLAAAERLGQSLAHGEPFLDPWVSEWALGYPVWRSYQPLPHLLAAGVMRVAEGFASHPAAFAALQYVLIAALPASVFATALGLGLCPLGAGLAALLILAPSGAAELGGYGLGYGATTWRGIGLYTEVVALHLLAWTLAFVARAVDEGRGRALASAFLALTALSHMVFGYVGFVSAAVLACVGPREMLPQRLMRLATVALPALLLLAWFLMPLYLARHDVGHCRWEAAYKWIPSERLTSSRPCSRDAYSTSDALPSSPGSCWPGRSPRRSPPARRSRGGSSRSRASGSRCSSGASRGDACSSSRRFRPTSTCTGCRPPSS